MKCQHYQNALKTQKIVAVYFKDVKTEETFSSQGQKLVDTTKCDNFIETKTLQHKFASAMTTALLEWNKWIKKWAHQNDKISQTLIKNGKTCNEKNRITDRHIKDMIPQKKNWNQKLSTPRYH